MLSNRSKLHLALAQRHRSYVIVRRVRSGARLDAGRVDDRIGPTVAHARRDREQQTIQNVRLESQRELVQRGEV